MDYDEKMIDLIQAFAVKYGGIVRTKDNQKLDVGQAFARHCYGENWDEMNLESVTREDYKKSLDWYNTGKHPDWVYDID